MINTQSACEELIFTLCGDEPPIIHDDEIADLEVYEATIVTDDEVGL